MVGDGCTGVVGADLTGVVGVDLTGVVGVGLIGVDAPEEGWECSAAAALLDFAI